MVAGRLGQKQPAVSPDSRRDPMERRMTRPIKPLKLDAFPCDPNRNSQVHRRVADKAFDVQGCGVARAHLRVGNQARRERSIPLSGGIECSVAFGTPGMRTAKLTTEVHGRTHHQSLPLYVDAHEWSG
jgi:hypothetical protein